MPQLCPIRWNLFLAISASTMCMLSSYFNFILGFSSSKEKKSGSKASMLFSGFGYFW